MIDTEQVRGRVDATFEYLEVEDFYAFGGKVAYDTGVWYFKELSEAGLTWAEMPTGGSTSTTTSAGSPGSDRPGPAPRGGSARQAAKLILVEQHLYRARRDRWGE